jgi:hypothetical protein
MRRLALATLAPLAGAVLLTAAVRTDQSADEAAIRATIQHYFDGGMSVRKAFHPTARMTFVRDSLVLVPIEDYLRRVEESAGKDGGWQEKRIASIDIANTAAVARLELASGDDRVTDYMTLLKIDGQWLIVNKTFSRM